MKRLAVLTAALAAAVLGGSCTPKDPSFKFTYAEMRGTLKSNGLRVVVIPDRTSPLVHVDVRYEVGSNEDPPGKAGLAHLVEHMMFQHRMLGPDKPATFDLLPQIAVNLNAYTTYDKTHYFLVAPKEELETLLKIEAFRMNALCETIPPEQFDREREVVRNEIRQRGGTPEGLIQPLTLEAIYPKGHPYSHTTGGDDAQLTNIKFEDVCDFLQKYYTPERATVIVTGNVGDPKQTILKVNEIFKGIPKRASAPRVAVHPIELKYKKVVHELDIERPLILVAWATPPPSSKEWNKVNALFSLVGKVAAEVDEWEIATSVEVIPPASLGGFGGSVAPVFVLGLELPPDGNIDEALEVIWKKTKTAGWGLKNLDFNREAKAFMKMDFVERLESLPARAERVADEIQFGDGSIAFSAEGRGSEYLMKDFFAIEKLTPDGYGEFAKKTLDKDKAVVVVFKPSKAGKKGDKRADLTFTATGHDKQPEPLVDPAEAKRPLPSPKGGSLLAKAVRYTLGNGMRVILLPTEGLPLVHAEMIFDVGAAHEPANKAGLASVAAGYLRPPRDATFTAFVSLGSSVDSDNTQFWARGLNIYTDVVITGLERVIKIGEYNQEAIERYQKRVKDRYKSADFRRDLAYNLATEAALYGKSHAYVAKGRPTPDSVDNIGYDAATAWKREHYTAKNATLIVVGNFDVKKVKGIIGDSFGEWDSGSKDQPVAAASAQRNGPVHIGIIGEERPQMTVTIAYPSPAGVDGQSAARLVLAEMLNERMGEIRTELGSTYGAYAGRSRNVGPNSYQMGAGVDAARAGESLKAMRAKVESLRQGENFDKTFALARRAVLKRLMADSAQTGALAGKLGGIAVFGLGPDYYDTLAKYVAAASPAQIKALIAAELDPKNEVVVCMADRKTLEKAFKEAGITKVTYEEPK
ncbi:MAG TPA: pitrilysin family protein [Kofleriaceae bacterium]|nr:pitrilysin family protein [Kofleriaceae bacterium]